MIDTIVGVITAIAFGIFIFWASQPVARTWFEFPKYKMLEDDRRFSDFDEDRDSREGDSSKL
jgi:hypothetical protein